MAYWNRLLPRMEAEGFPVQDKPYRTASEAEDRLQHLLTVLHYLGCAEVTGRLVALMSAAVLNLSPWQERLAKTAPGPP